MAKSGYKDIQATDNDVLRFSWWFDKEDQSATENTTLVRWKKELIADAHGRISSKVEKDWSVVVDGKPYNGKNMVNLENGETKLLASGTTLVKHNADGTKTFNYSFSQELAINFSGKYIGTVSGSGTGVLDTIPRKSELYVNDGILGIEQTLIVERNSKDFTHTITFICGSASDIICTKTSSDSVKWTPPLTLANQNTTGNDVLVKIAITTYDGSGNELGINNYTITCEIPSSVRPSVSLVLSDPTECFNKYGAYVQNKSHLKAVASASGSYGSTISKYVFARNGQTYVWTEGNEFTLELLDTSGEMTFSVTVTDSRGRTETAETKIAIIPYLTPKITSLSAKRCDVSGNNSNSGEYLAVRFSASVTALNNKNTAVYTLQYKKSSDSTYTTKELTDYTNQYLVSDGVFIFVAEKTSGYDIALTLKDDFKEISKNTNGSTVRRLWSVWKKMFGIAIGKIADIANLLDVDLPARFRQGVTIDSDWVELTLENSFVVYNGEMQYQPKYKERAGIVTIKGIVSPTEPYDSVGYPKIIASGIPERLRPDTQLWFVCQGSGMRQFTLVILTDGRIGVSRYGINSLEEVPIDASLAFCVTYQV